MTRTAKQLGVRLPLPKRAGGPMRSTRQRQLDAATQRLFEQELRDYLTSPVEATKEVPP